MLLKTIFATINNIPNQKIRVMKKVMMMSIAVAAILLSSCGNNAKPGAASDADSLAVVDSVPVLAPETQNTVNALTGELTKVLQGKDNQKVVAALANLQTMYKNLVSSGKLEEAKGYGEAIKKFVNEHADNIKQFTSGNATIASLVQGIQNLPTSAATTAEEAKAAVATDVTKLASPAISKGATAVAAAESAAEAVKNAPENVKNAAEAAASNAKAAAENKVNEEVTKAQTKTNEAVNKAAEKANQKVNEAANKAVKGLGL
ncbi:hypothetical protein SAMN04487825_1239 [Prevotella sp. kh1p2]|nr:hypothetical protein SAMN04487825_1239 [Prevotella sp. kh1p2]SNU12354.1 hypothetical protein SAMN06298210_1239 [Prevotellaceae bacterium KH2P17]